MSEPVKRYWLMRDYGAYEGWKRVGEYRTSLADVAKLREQEINGGVGGPLVIVEVIDLADAYAALREHEAVQQFKALAT